MDDEPMSDSEWLEALGAGLAVTIEADGKIRVYVNNYIMVFALKSARYFAEKLLETVEIAEATGWKEGMDEVKLL